MPLSPQRKFLSQTNPHRADLRYTLKKWLTIPAGINNIFDVYTDPIQNAADTDFGNDIFSKETSPFAYNGDIFWCGNRASISEAIGGINVGVYLISICPAKYKLQRVLRFKDHLASKFSKHYIGV
jgi:hypothetical protein